MWNLDNPSSRNYGMNTHSWVLESPDPFWTEVQGWYNPTTFTGTEISGYILNWGLGMMQAYHFHGGWDLRIHFEPRFRDDAIHHFHGADTSRYILNQGSGMMQSTTFMRAETFEYILNRSSGMMQSYHFHEGQDLQIHFEPRFKDDAIHHFHEGRDLRIHFEPKSRDDAVEKLPRKCCSPCVALGWTRTL